MHVRIKAILIVPIMIALLFACIGAIAFGFMSLLTIPGRLNLPFSIRVIGGLLLAAGGLFNLWIFIHRNPLDVLTSTYIMIRNVLKRNIPIDPKKRAEPLILTGPQRHVRHPMYFLVLLYLSACWLVFDYTFIAFMIPLFVIWFNFVIIPIEERELRFLFGEQYASYEDAVPKLIPSIRRKWHA